MLTAEREKEIRFCLKKFSFTNMEEYDAIEDLIAELDRLRNVLIQRDAAIQHRKALEEIDRKEISQLREKLAVAMEALEFYLDDENWAACCSEDTVETCCHMVGEISGGNEAKKALAKIRGEK
jgi:hypothetical protein